nr:retrovirus-related Pol polyprotein from transposon TNT 1-94 [Tanacetum cinerariifolium]
MEAKVDQNDVDKKSAEIERKNLLIENENLIVDCLSNEVFYTATNYVLTVSRFSEMHNAYTVVQARCLELEAEISKLKHKIQKDDHSEMLKCFSNLEELLEYVIGTCPKHFNKRDKKIATTPLIRKKQVTFTKTCDTSNKNTQAHLEHTKVQQTNVLVILSTRVNCSTKASGSKPRRNTKNTRILPAKSCSKHMMGNCSRLKNFVKKFIGTVSLRNDHFGAIMGYEDYMIGDSVIFRVYYVEGIGHNFFYIGQFYDSDLEVAFRKHSCYVRNEDSVNLLKGSHGLNLYTISVEDMMKSSLICLLSKASKNKSWLWHRRLNYLNFDTINDLSRKDLVRGLPRLKFKKDHLCSACQLGKSKKYTHKPKYENIIMEVLHTLYIDLCGPMRVQSVNRNKYIWVIVDDYLRFTWVKFLRSKDETSEFVFKFLKQIQVGFHKIVRYIRTINGTEFVNQFLSEFYESVGIFYQKICFENSSAERHC